MILQLTKLFLAMVFIPIAVIALSISFVKLDLSLMNPLYWSEGVRGLCVLWAIAIGGLVGFHTAINNKRVK